MRSINAIRSHRQRKLKSLLGICLTNNQISQANRIARSLMISLIWSGNTLIVDAFPW